MTKRPLLTGDCISQLSSGATLIQKSPPAPVQDPKAPSVIPSHYPR
jgi:hypothetical protein